MGLEDFVNKNYPRVAISFDQFQRYPKEAFVPGIILVALRDGFGGQAGRILVVRENLGDYVIAQGRNDENQSVVYFLDERHGIWTNSVYVLSEAEAFLVEGYSFRAYKDWLRTTFGSL
jgi:hypothetical protein